MILTYILLLVLGQCIVMDNAFAVLLPLQNNTNCQNDCEMIITDQQNVYQKFREKANIKSVRVIRFHMMIDDKPYRPFDSEEYLFAWSRAAVGEPVFSLPLDYISACLFLPLIFYDQLQIKLKSSKERCRQDLSDACLQNIIFKTLINFTRVNKCDTETCDTICRKRFHFNNILPFHDEEYSCCDVGAFYSDSIDISSCTKKSPGSVFLQLDIVITIVSILALIPLYISIARRYIRWQGR